MDPNFLFSVTQVSQQLQAAQTIAIQQRREALERQHKATLLDIRRLVLDNANKQASKLQESMELEPEKAVIQASLTLIEMDTTGCKPDAFDELKDKEAAVLTWRRLLNLREKILGQLTDAQIER